MLPLHDCLDVIQIFTLADVEVMKNTPLAMPMAEVSWSLRRHDAGWGIKWVWSRHDKSLNNCKSGNNLNGEDLEI